MRCAHAAPVAIGEIGLDDKVEVDPGLQRAVLRVQLELHRSQLAAHEETRQVIASVADQEPRLERSAVFWELVRDLGERNERMYIDWLEDAIATVGRME